MQVLKLSPDQPLLSSVTPLGWPIFYTVPVQKSLKLLK